jgi:hypothetical protein
LLTRGLIDRDGSTRTASVSLARSNRTATKRSARKSARAARRSGAGPAAGAAAAAARLREAVAA